MLTLTIMPDFGGAFCWWSQNDEADQKMWVGSCGGLPRVRVGTRLRQHPLEADFIEWQADFEALPMNPEAWGRFDWRLFHRQGLRLARKLKRQLGAEYRVVYEKPTEDPNAKYSERREVMMDGTLKRLIGRVDIKAAIVAKEPTGSKNTVDQ